MISAFRAELVWRVLDIRCGTETGTGFVLVRNDNAFLVTAKHLCPDLYNRDKVHVAARDGDRTPYRVVKVGFAPDPIDIAVYRFDDGFPLPANTALHAIHEGSHQLVLGQLVQFAGFPLGFRDNSPVGCTNRPLPLVRAACCSARQLESTGRLYWLLDGHNNRGMSGGPAFFIPDGQDGPVQILGVVSSYQVDDIPVEDADGNVTAHAKENLGLFRVWDVRYATAIIDGTELTP